MTNFKKILLIVSLYTTNNALQAGFVPEQQTCKPCFSDFCSAQQRALLAATSKINTPGSTLSSTPNTTPRPKDSSSSTLIPTQQNYHGQREEAPFSLGKINFLPPKND